MAFDIFGNDCHRCAGDRQEVQHHRKMMEEMAKEYHAESMRQLELELKQGKE